MPAAIVIEQYGAPEVMQLQQVPQQRRAWQPQRCSRSALVLPGSRAAW